ncbi:DUF2490 domain-containing protein [Xanthomarina sp. F2636L]|uniref:DUF2490 domain-containing protein n=1 Tax=Xanthomarina sp. F2636L TaxID=2996018 RepID=UPI00225E16FA|nr:DUF2490 domain-containing protein [Xanthomarina sp. F2636L]MCX7551799.1 DUF2490 domain-containing protein [Xanthomarina sp. F2636L]
MKHFFFLLLCLFLSVLQVKAQDSIPDQEIKVNQQLWLDYNFLNLIDSTKVLATEIGYRKITPKVFNRFLVHSTLNIPHEKSLDFLNLKKPIIESFQLGAGIYYTHNYNTDDNLEFRLAQGFKFLIPTLRGVSISNYIRLEERFQNTFNNSGWTTGYRFRYRISTEINWKKHLTKFTDGIYIPLSLEMFFNLKKSDRYNDLIRISPGIGYRLKNEWRFEVYLIFNETKNSTETNKSSSDFILRIRVYKGKLSNPSKEVQLEQLPESN